MGSGGEWWGVVGSCSRNNYDLNISKQFIVVNHNTYFYIHMQ